MSLMYDYFLSDKRKLACSISVLCICSPCGVLMHTTWYVYSIASNLVTRTAYNSCYLTINEQLSQSANIHVFNLRDLTDLTSLFVVKSWKHHGIR